MRRGGEEERRRRQGDDVTGDIWQPYPAALRASWPLR